ncbi:MAG TPA: NYN domain-containing protein, partial [Chloroflexota bacterium]|nr:NYN domain-containing protein [Chloroflexota bacterium]
MRATVYVDGFNLYYGCLRGTNYRWLNLGRLCHLLVPTHEIHRIRYFTARVQSRPDDPQKAARQQLYLRALQTIPQLSIHYGHYLSQTVRMPLAHPSPTGPKTVEVMKTEEKGSDVNIATYLLVDSYAKDDDLAVVMSNDSDLKLPIELVRQNLGRDVGVLNPHHNVSRALHGVATFYKPIRTGVLAASLFPSTLTDSHGAFT